MNKNKRVRVRMAPSPTGEYHIGHIRTVLYNWAYAKAHGGDFIIRIEDTDRERLVEGATERILKVIEDYGLNWDEGPQKGGEVGPYVQSERLEIYKEYIQKLVDQGDAYYCFCTTDRLAQMRKEQQEKGAAVTKYDRKCLSLSKDEVKAKIEGHESYVIRMKVPENEMIDFNDAVYGKIEFNSNDIDDQVLLKSDGFPTYHFAVVVDDHLMNITHVMRGNDWLPSTPKHIILYKAFGWEIPQYIHLPNLKEQGGTKKLSKRYGPVSAREFLDEGYLAEALLNFLMLLGWNPGTEKEIYSLDEFVADFSVDRIHKTDLVAFDRNKLTWMNGQYIAHMDNNELAKRIYDFYKGKFDLKIIDKIVDLVKTRIKKLSEFEEMCRFLFERPNISQSEISDETREYLELALNKINLIQNWELQELNDALMKVITDNNFSTGKFFMSLRYNLSGQKITPPINESMIILGKDEVQERLKKALGK